MSDRLLPKHVTALAGPVLIRTPSELALLAAAAVTSRPVTPPAEAAEDNQEGRITPPSRPTRMAGTPRARSEHVKRVHCPSPSPSPCRMARAGVRPPALPSSLRPDSPNRTCESCRVQLPSRMPICQGCWFTRWEATAKLGVFAKHKRKLEED